MYNLTLEFSNNKLFNSIFGNQSSIKKKQLFFEFNNGLVFQDNLSNSGNVVISNNEFIDIEHITSTQSLPLEASLKQFYNILRNPSYISNLDLAVDVNKVLDLLENFPLE